MRKTDPITPKVIEAIESQLGITIRTPISWDGSPATLRVHENSSAHSACLFMVESEMFNVGQLLIVLEAFKAGRDCGKAKGRKALQKELRALLGSDQDDAGDDGEEDEE